MPNTKKELKGKRKGKQKPNEAPEVDVEEMQGGRNETGGMGTAGGGIEGHTPELPIAETEGEGHTPEPPITETEKVKALIHNPGNGLRVRDVKVFLRTPFAQPVTQDALCQEFAQQEVLDMLMTRLPEEPALVGHHIQNTTLI